MSGLSPLKQMTELKNPKTGARRPIPEGWTVLRNNVYTVVIDRARDENQVYEFMGMLVMHLSIKRNDRKPVHSWADLQWLKNQIAGEEAEAVELFPAESRVLDAANQTHLWVVNGRFPIGWDETAAHTGSPEEAALWGAEQNRRQK